MNEPARKKVGVGAGALVAIIATCLLSVFCLGGAVAIAFPAFVAYLNESKIAEAENNLRYLYNAAVGYYEEEVPAGPLAGGPRTHCATTSGATSNTPTSTRTRLPNPLGEPFDSLGFSLLDPVYFRYEVIGAGGCDHQPGDPLYSFRAYGDLDGDGSTSLFEVTAWAGADGRLERSPHIRRVDPVE